MERPACLCHSNSASRGRGHTLYSNNPTQHNLEKQLETIGAHTHANYYQEQRIRAKPKLSGKVPRIRPEPLRIASVQFPTDYDDNDYDDEGDNNNLFTESPANDYDEKRNTYSAASNFERYDDDTFDFSIDNQVPQMTVPETVAVKQDKNFPPKTGRNNRKEIKRLNVALNNIHKLKE